MIKKLEKQEEKEVFVKHCTLCNKKFRTCNRMRSLCEVCSERPSTLNKIKVVQRSNRDGVSYTTKCICCGQEFKSCNSTRYKCTSCVCDDIGISPSEVVELFKLGNEPDNTMPENMKVPCFHCSLKKKCGRRKNKYHSLKMCCSGEWVKCSQCVFAPKCDKRLSERAKDCRNGVIANSEDY